MSGAAKRRDECSPHGQIRQSQVVTTFGPGAMVDLPDHAVIVGGLDTGPATTTTRSSRSAWRPRCSTLLSRAVRQVLRAAAGQRRSDARRSPASPRGCFPSGSSRSTRSATRRGRAVPAAGASDGPRQGHDISAPTARSRTRWCRSGSSRPARAATSATSTGEGSSTHGDPTCRQPLWLDERGTSGDSTDITVRCECGQSKALLGGHEVETCRSVTATATGRGSDNGARALRRGSERRAPAQPAAGALGVERLLRPDAVGHLDSRRRTECATPSSSVWASHLEAVTSLQELAFARKMAAVKVALEEFSDPAVWAEIERPGRPGAAFKGHPRSRDRNTASVPRRGR